MNKRRSVRFTVELPVSLCSDSHQGEGTVLDISREGCRIGYTDSLAVGEFSSLYIVVPSYFLPITIGIGAVRWATSTELGLEFIRMPPVQQKRLDALLSIHKRILMESSGASGAAYEGSHP